MKSTGVFRFLAAGCFLASAVSATTIRNAATDFSTISNPTGVWSYGTSGTTLGGALTLYTTTFSSSGVYVWGGAGSPLVGSNTNASTVMLSNSAFLQPGQLLLSRGPTASTAWFVSPRRAPTSTNSSPHSPASTS